MSNRFSKIHPVAEAMANTYEEHAMYTAGISYLSETGYKELKEKFGNVLPEMRATVFNDFTKELTRRGVAYDVEDFKE